MLVPNSYAKLTTTTCGHCVFSSIAFGIQLNVSASNFKAACLCLFFVTLFSHLPIIATTTTITTTSTIIYTESRQTSKWMKQGKKNIEKKHEEKTKHSIWCIVVYFFARVLNMLEMIKRKEVAASMALKQQRFNRRKERLNVSVCNNKKSMEKSP